VSNQSSAAQHAISLPKGGGAIKGIGETFQPNLFTGTGNHTIPLALSPGRNGFGPKLSLEYSSGNGNGLFGLGWQLSVPRITRKTEKGLPRYGDTDVFVLSGAEDLVPCLKEVTDPTSGQETWVPEDPIDRPLYTVYRYRPRTEGLFARIERWQHKATHDVHWRTITRDNVTSIYGGRMASRIADPDNAQRVYEWLLQETFDATGNHILYEYARDDPRLYTDADPSIRLPEIFEQHRTAMQLYLRRIYYGNLPEPLVDAQGHSVTYTDGTPVGHLRDGRRYAFEVVFDYGDWEMPTKLPHPEPLPAGQQELFGADPATSTAYNPVPIRTDRFSHGRAGFDIRTLRRCRRILMFHHFAELGGPTLVRSTDFTYHIDADTLASLLTAVTVTGYETDVSGQYRSASMPPVTFTYTDFRPHEQRYQSLTAEGNDLPPLALNDPNMTLVDLFGDGLPDILHSGPGGFRYWRNLGGGRLDRPRLLPQVPASIALDQPGVGFGDMAGDGQVDLLVHAGPLPGFYETTTEGIWKTFKPYTIFPSFDLQDRNVRLVDLTGDGRSDVLMTQDKEFLWFACLGEQGFAPAQYIPRQHDLDEFPDVFFDDPTGRVRLADMTGDGLNDIVLLHNGRVDYWPNLGYGRFGKRVTMENAPHLDVNFDPKRLFLADLNGSGCADLVYVDFGCVHFWFNQSGNRWSEQQTILGTPTVSDVDSLQFADVFGTGTATLVWSYHYAGQPEGHYKALDFCGGVKPYVLTEMSNNLGTTTRVSYAPSTKYFLEDQANGTPWLTKLPFPVQVVDTVEVIDHISKTKLVTTYKYHHGYFDGREREFRGFGRVDQFDTESFEDFTQSGLHGAEAAFTNNAEAYHVPPVETRSWFHAGVYFDDSSSQGFDYRELTKAYQREFYQGDTQAVPLDEHEVETGETPHAAYRALRGALLHSEVYGHDGSAKAAHPYRVTENRYRVTQLQPQGGNHHAVYFQHQLESLTYHYERQPSDPRLSQALTLEVDAFGNPRKALAIGYGRRQPDPGLPTQADRDRQTQTLITYTDTSYTNAIDDPLLTPDAYRAPLTCETRTYELTGFQPAANAQRFSLEEWLEDGFARLNSAMAIGYAEQADLTKPQKRLIEHVRTRYRADDLTDLLPLGVSEALALPGETYKLALTPGLLAQVYGGRVTEAMLASDGGYVHSKGEATWWIPSGRVFYSAQVTDTPAQELVFAQQHFFLPHRARDPFGNTGFTDYDHYHLLPTQTTDALGNRTTAGYDYRLLQPCRVTDPNGNRAEVAFDTLGLVVGTAVMGKATEAKGDSLAGFVPDLTPQQRQAFLADPLGHAASLLGQASTRIVYDLQRYLQSQQPVFAATLARETHASEALPAGGLKVQVSLSYSDGFGRDIQKKIQAEPGPVVEGGPVISPRWVGSGWVIFNNKGKPVKQYEPFFDDTHAFRFGQQVGVSSTLFYDPLERAVATLHPNHTWDKVVFDPWRQETWDVNDTALIEGPKSDADVGEYFRRLSASDYLPTWYAQRQGGALGEREQVAAAKTSMHAETPAVAYADALGRAFLTIVHNRFGRPGTGSEERHVKRTVIGTVIDEHYATRVIFDIEGNQREVLDANDRAVMRYDYDMLGTRVHQASMEAGERWMLNDVSGQPIYAWDSRGHRFRTTYDALRRPLDIFLQADGSAELLVSRTVYGESQPNPEAHNLRGRVVRHCDQAGVVTSEAYDFKGNLLASRRQVARDYQNTLDWLANPALDPQVFTSRTTYDALNRPTSATAPDGSVYRPRFNEANLLEQVEVHLRGAATSQPFVTDIDYDAKGQPRRIDYGNGVRTTYAYDPLTFRLSRLQTLRGAERLQDLGYTYDPAGNITHVHDDAQQTLYFNNQVVAPHGDYTYDAIYRLITAEGREHVGQVAQPQTTWDDAFRSKLQHSQDGQAMRRYTERYDYDSVGNFSQVIHQATNGNWTRSYAYDEASLIEPSRQSNRLSSTVVGGGTPETYPYDAHGNMTAMPHLPSMNWDFHDQLRHVDLAGGGEAYYVYDATGQRLRKVIEKNGGALIEERLYLGGFEIFRRRDATGTVTLERETFHVMDDTQRIALVETRTQGNEAGVPPQLVRYQFGNHLGSACLELDAGGLVISYEEYYPYGGTSYQAGRSAAEVRLKRYRYTGKERDEETGFTYHLARYYAPWLGRWASADSIGIKDGFNLYVYGHDNPLTYVDPTGTECPSEQDLTQAAVAEEFNTAVAQGAAQWKTGDRGERFRTGGYKGPTRASYTKPMAIDAAKQGDYEAAEFYENYMCPSCHVGRATKDPNFSVEGYVRNYQNNYRTGQCMVLSAAVGGGLAVTVPRTAALLGAWTTGTSLGQAATGRSVGVIDPMNFFTGDREIGRRLSTTERVFSATVGAVGAFGMAKAKLTPFTTPSDLTIVGPGPAGGTITTAGGGPLRVVSPVFTYGGRDILIVETSVGRQGFYRSTGTSSGMPGRWLPFDEILEHELIYAKGWVNKGEYVRPGDSRLHRFGSEEFRSISDALTGQNIPPSTFILQDEAHVNQIMDFFGARLTGNNFFRPTPDFRAPANR
jgi:RHS repeat-associated protein